MLPSLRRLLLRMQPSSDGLLDVEEHIEVEEPLSPVPLPTEHEKVQVGPAEREEPEIPLEVLPSKPSPFRVSDRKRLTGQNISQSLGYA